MLIPQFSIRWLLALTVVCAGVFSILQAALGGSHWATGVSIAIGSAVVLLLAYAATFALVWLISLVSVRPRRRRPEPGQSPFSQGTPAMAADRDIDKDIPATPILLE
ncbi:MAG: hypothetical protein V3R99_10240 [Thermoguttaceae bacterium]